MNIFRLLLLPLAVIYDGITRVKNFLYDQHILASAKFDIPLIVIGNLAVGGTGKTPHTEWAAKILKLQFQTAILSRGYGRKTKGYVLAQPHSTSKEIGDEPLQIFKNNMDLPIAVCENRAVGVAHLLKDFNPEVVILDDAFQHRKISGSMYILLTTYQKMFYNDWVLPAGNLRETSINKNRAHIIIVTKCPLNLSKEEKQRIIQEIQPKDSQKVFFSAIQYQKPSSVNGNYFWNTPKKVILVTGIVNPDPLRKHIIDMGTEVQLMAFPDHYDYSLKDVDLITKIALELGEGTVVATTSKDAVKLQPLFQNLDLPLFEFPITIQFLFNQEEEIKNQLINHVREIQRSR
jgi:tetraacyldisaccharide 4'-kinase